MQGRIQDGGADVYDRPEHGKKLFDLPGGHTLEILDSCGDVYAVKVFGRSEPAYVNRLEVDIVPEAEIVPEFKLAAQGEQAPPVDPKEPADFAGDKVGGGRYALSFLMLGFLGVWIAYWARYYGWRCIWINGAIYGALWVCVLVSAVAA